MLTQIVHRSTLRYTTGCISTKLNSVPSRKVKPFKFLTSRRHLATVASDTIIIGPPPDSPAAADPVIEFDRHLLSVLERNNSTVSAGGRDEDRNQKCLKDLVQDYVANSGRVLERSLKYESRPGLGRKLYFGDSGCRVPGGPRDNASVGTRAGVGGEIGKWEEGVVMVAHCIKARGSGEKFKVVSCSGFVIDVYDGLVVTCAHTFEEMRRSPLNEDKSGVISGSFVIAPRSAAAKSQDSSRDFDIHAVTAVPSCLPKSDILLLTPSPSAQPLKSLPVSPYPLSIGKPVRAHFVKESSFLTPVEERNGWEPWIGGTRRSWVKGVVKGYRDFAGRQAEPGTYDALNHLLFSPTPTPGSSGGPIVDEETGAVVGVILGSRMDNRVEGERGWGVPGEVVFEMFSLPGLKGKK